MAHWSIFYFLTLKYQRLLIHHHPFLTSPPSLAAWFHSKFLKFSFTSQPHAHKEVPFKPYRKHFQIFEMNYFVARLISLLVGRNEEEEVTKYLRIQQSLQPPSDGVSHRLQMLGGTRKLYGLLLQTRTQSLRPPPYPQRSGRKTEENSVSCLWLSVLSLVCLTSLSQGVYTVLS